MVHKLVRVDKNRRSGANRKMSTHPTFEGKGYRAIDPPVILSRCHDFFLFVCMCVCVWKCARVWVCVFARHPCIDIICLHSQCSLLVLLPFSVMVSSCDLQTHNLIVNFLLLLLLGPGEQSPKYTVVNFYSKMNYALQ